MLLVPAKTALQLLAIKTGEDGKRVEKLVSQLNVRLLAAVRLKNPTNAAGRKKVTRTKKTDVAKVTNANK